MKLDHIPKYNLSLKISKKTFPGYVVSGGVDFAIRISQSWDGTQT